MNKFLTMFLASSLAIGCSRNATSSGLSAGEGFIDVPGGKVWYRITGSGTATPLLALHGGPGFPSDYLTPLTRLADERPIILYDQLGGGKSDRPADKSLWKTERFVQELAAVREKLGLKEVHILGHSWGTMLATDYMLTKPAGVRSLILSSPAISIPRWLADANVFRSQLPADVQATLKKHEDAGTTDSQEYQDAVTEYYKLHLCRIFPYPSEMESTMKNAGMDVYLTMWGPSEFFGIGNLKDYDRSSRLNEIRVPVLYTAGRYDEATPESTQYYQGLTPGASFVMFENSSHMAMLEETDRYIQVVRDFLHRVEGK